jgi:hypothetical protein
MTTVDIFIRLRERRAAGEPKYVLGPDFAAELALDLVGRYPLLQSIEIAGRAHSLLVRLRRLEERAATMGTNDAA